MQNLVERKLTDLALVSYLVTTGQTFIRTSLEGRSVAFHFKNDPQLEQAILDYYNGKTTVDAKRLFSNWKMLKGMVLGGNANGGFDRR